MKFDKDKRILVLRKDELIPFAHDLPISSSELRHCMPKSRTPLEMANLVAVYEEEAINFIKVRGPVHIRQDLALTLVLIDANEKAFTPVPDNFSTIFSQG